MHPTLDSIARQIHAFHKAGYDSRYLEIAIGGETLVALERDLPYVQGPRTKRPTIMGLPFVISDTPRVVKVRKRQPQLA